MNSRQSLNYYIDLEAELHINVKVKVKVKDKVNKSCRFIFFGKHEDE